MKIKPKHLRHPLRSVNSIRNLLRHHFEEKKFANQGKRYFSDDARYVPENVTAGFADRVEPADNDTVLLNRICDAYAKAVEQESFVSETYRATEWWEQQRYGSLEPVRLALSAFDVDALYRMYRNFYRDPCSAGLIAPQCALNQYFSPKIRDVHRRFYLADTLYRLDLWQVQTEDHFSLSDLAGPEIGNPFGLMVDNTLIRIGAEYQHYCAFRLGNLLSSGASTVAEIGGGFGGMAYYLLRDHPQTTYLSFDVPESIALMSYYLIKAFPQLQFLLFGEKELTAETIAQADVVLMPVFELTKMPPRSVDIIFSSHAMSNLSSRAVVEYLTHITHMGRNYFLDIGDDHHGESPLDLKIPPNAPLELAEVRASEWNRHRISHSQEVERLYRITNQSNG
ncbi:putative sugar O-methyltransferase [Granulicella sp. dw_53]|uniref:putative sugar O-methyltransferase n=1 Tax=Granulicella sp. dw_53 TaxID=2719792 RepID=UPI001BD3005C|nr:putative sugar O-methyltransferase [Granulicella sp. dw_53]